MSTTPEFKPDSHPSGGWGSLKAVTTYLLREGAPVTTSRALLRQNKHDGFACVSCAWAKSAHPHTAEFCENGAKATAWELTAKRMPADFFKEHTVTALAQLERPCAGSRRTAHRADCAGTPPPTATSK